ncbi:hypothetical protein T07_10105 [Trichinella nelsoni]|uniref:Uncharacterized protein n=1 Tax=Trichinella nelsoni TaxID=6336 RepID=A0A0V0S8X7_9BILA|nr:hypothetical protein T07_10105 [Trichinella nelsoni]
MKWPEGLFDHRSTVEAVSSSEERAIGQADPIMRQFVLLGYNSKILEAVPGKICNFNFILPEEERLSLLAHLGVASVQRRTNITACCWPILCSR